MNRCIFCFLLILSFNIVLSQTKWREYEVESVDFIGNSQIHSDILRINIQTEESPWGFWRIISYVSEKIGGKKQYYIPSRFASDFEQIKMFYLENGFFFSSIDTVIEPDHIKKRVKLTFKIFEGPRSNIDTITYLGLDQMSIEFLSDFYNNALIKKGDPFNKQFVMCELKRILTTFVNSGFINVKIDTVLTRRFASTNNISILFSVNP